jgi:hypothetical protein
MFQKRQPPKLSQEATQKFIFKEVWSKVKYYLEHLRVAYLRAGEENEYFNKRQSYEMELWAFKQYKNNLIIELEKLEDDLVERIQKLED